MSQLIEACDCYKGIPANRLMAPHLLNVEITHSTCLNKLHMADHGLAWPCMPRGACHESITKWG